MFSIGAVVVLVFFEMLHRRGVGRGSIAAGSVNGRPNPFAVGVGLLCLAAIPFFFDTAASINSTGFLSTSSHVLAAL